MRCKACNNILGECDMYIREETNEFEDLCIVCRKASQLDVDREEIDVTVELGFTPTWDD